MDALNGFLVDDSDPEMDALTASVVSGPSHAASFNLNTDGSFYYKPQSGWAGMDQIVYAAHDGTSSANATVYIWTPRLKVGVSSENPVLGEVWPEELTQQSNTDSGAGFFVYLPDGAVDFDVTIPLQVLGQTTPVFPEKVTGFAILGTDFSNECKSNADCDNRGWFIL